MSTTGDIGQYRAYLKRYEELEVEQLVYCNLLVRRKKAASAPVTVRRQMGQRCARAELAWLLDWEAAGSTMDFSGLLLVASPAMEVVVRHKMLEGSLQPVEYTMTSTVPFTAKLATPQWVALLVSECNGRRTASEVYGAMKEHGPIERQQFDAAVRTLLSAGILQLSTRLSYGSPN